MKFIEILKQGKTISDCMYAGKTYTHGSIFAKTDGCNMCVCNHGLVTCTNATGCAQNTDQTTGMSITLGLGIMPGLHLPPMIVRFFGLRFFLLFFRHR